MEAFEVRRRAIPGTIVRCLIGAALAPLATATAHAQEQPAAAQASTAPDAGDIIVTATRRATRLQETPISVTAVSGAQMEQRRLLNAEDLVAEVPNARIANKSGTAGSYPQIRGVAGSEPSPGADLPVAVFIDDIYFGSGTSYLNNFFDVDQVQVLRGPQGTTFGRNVTGGAFVITNKAPEFTQDAGMAVTARSNPGIEASGFFNTVVVPDRVAARFSFSTRNADGTARDRTTGDKAGNINITSLRGQLLWTPSEATRVRASLTYTRDTSDPSVYSWLVNGITPTLVAPLASDPDHVDIKEKYNTHNESLFGAVNVQQDLDWATLTSISTYRWSHNEFNSGQFTPVSTQELNIPQRDNQFSQEFRLTSPTRNEGLEWILGVYYLHLRSSFATNASYHPIAGTRFAELQPLGFTGRYQEVTTESIAPFVEGVYHFTPKIALRAGIRYTTDKKNGRTDHYGVLGAIIPQVYDVDYGKRFDAFTPRVIVEIKPSRDIFIYGSASRGFKSGGYSAFAGVAAEAIVPINPETVWSYEAGAKTTWFDKRLLLNVTVFRADTKNLQQRVFIPSIVGYRLTNAGSSRAKGVEVELGLRPVDGLNLRASYGYINAKYTSFLRCQPTIDCTGNHQPFVPKHTLSASARYDQPLAGGGTIYGSIAGQYASKTELEPVNQLVPRSLIDKTELKGVFDVVLGWVSPSENWDLSLWGKNLTDERAISGELEQGIYVYSRTQVAAGNQAFRVGYNPGRSYGATLRWRM